MFHSLLVAVLVGEGLSDCDEGDSESEEWESMRECALGEGHLRSDSISDNLTCVHVVVQIPQRTNREAR